METINHSHMRSLYLKFSSIYGRKFTSEHETEEMRNIWYSTWYEGLKDISLDCAKKSVNQCMISLKWPPSLAEFRSICESLSGLPNEFNVMNSLVRKDFSHPVVMIFYEKIGSWNVSNLKENDLLSRIRECYQECINIFRENPSKFIHNERSTVNPYIPSGSYKEFNLGEISMFRSNMSNWMKKSKTDLEEKMNIGLKHPEWDLDKCNKYSTKFDEDLYRKRRDYLVSVSWEDSVNLSNDDKYDRIRFIREDDGMRIINKNSFFTGKSDNANTRTFNLREKFEYK